MTNTKTRKTVVNVGVDVGKASLDIVIHEKGLHWQEDNTVEGIGRILRRLSHYQVERLVMEATGRYEFELAQAAYNKGLPVCIAKPLSVRRYAGAVEQLAKTDKIDAAIIAEYAAVVKPRATPQKSKNLIAIKNLVVRRRQLVNLRTQEMNRLKIMGKAFEVSCRRISISYHSFGSLRESTHVIEPPSEKTAEFNIKACQPSGNSRGYGGTKFLAISILKPNLE